MQRTRACFPFILAAVVLGCRAEPTSPLTGERYVLESIAGVAVPAPYFGGPNDNFRIVADTIALGGSGTGLRRTVYETVTPFERHAVETHFEYSVQATAIVIYFPCPANADCIAGPHLSGTLLAESMNITQSAGTLVPLVYRRLFPLD
jgi:hypothetical protein